MGSRSWFCGTLFPAVEPSGRSRCLFLSSLQTPPVTREEDKSPARSYRSLDPFPTGFRRWHSLIVGCDPGEELPSFLPKAGVTILIPLIPNFVSSLPGAFVRRTKNPLGLKLNFTGLQNNPPLFQRGLWESFLRGFSHFERKALGCIQRRGSGW